jgi:ribosomal protein L11 methyltransferase
MNSRALWAVSIATTLEAGEATALLLEQHTAQTPITYTDADTGRTTITSYLEQRPEWPALCRLLSTGLRHIRECGLKTGNTRVPLQRLRREDWAESWKRHFKPIHVGAELLIKPSWSKRKPRRNQAVAVLDPGLSFGTGHHPTTSFCLEQLAVKRTRLSADSASFLDIGTGSGILAIAAVKLGYAPVHAFDYDPESIAVASANARQNRVLDHVRIWRADLLKLPRRSVRTYDVVCANLISDLLVAERDRILARLKSSGLLVLAGILKREFVVVQRAYQRAGLKLVSSAVKNEWRSGAFRFLD